jgi:hypothetical protein
MTHDERKAARERCDKASAGPWRPDIDDGVEWTGRIYTGREKNYAWLTYEDHHPDHLANVHFFCAARTDLPAALDALDSADRRIAELESLVASQAERIAAQSALLARKAEK